MSAVARLSEGPAKDSERRSQAEQDMMEVAEDECDEGTVSKSVCFVLFCLLLLF
jgi:hypothetical protein